jgi:vacuolar-type H+-ATPase subunit H
VISAPGVEQVLKLAEKHADDHRAAARRDADQIIAAARAEADRIKGD